MKIIRADRRERYTVTDRRTVNDESLSFRARGVLVWLLDKPDGWETSSDAIAAAGTEGRDAIRAAQRELEAAGYITRERSQDERGRWSTALVVRERPTTENPASVNQPSVDRPSEDQSPTTEAEEMKTEREPSSSVVFDADDPKYAEPKRLCDLLADLIVENGASKRPSITKAWLDAIERMIRIDDIAPDRIERAIRFSQRDEFWRGNVLSAPTLRKQFEKLRLAAQRQSTAVARRDEPNMGRSFDALMRSKHRDEERAG